MPYGECLKTNARMAFAMIHTVDLDLQLTLWVGIFQISAFFFALIKRKRYQTLSLAPAESCGIM
ncbi:MAG: hypothetical protein OXM61_25040 [Candidatus Poribacteria bacterium]|nr:hypothetical protein [Candidatus Poribacteria bacterium]